MIEHRDKHGRITRTPLTPIQRFVKFVDIRDPDDCWLWTGALAGSLQYGCFWDGSENTRAHRWLFQRFHQATLTATEYVCHTCDTPRCVNPNHLFLGSHSDNIRDCVAKGRHGDMKRTHCKHGHEFTPDNVRMRYKNGSAFRSCLTCRRARDKMRDRRKYA